MRLDEGLLRQVLHLRRVADVAGKQARKLALVLADKQPKGRPVACLRRGHKFAVGRGAAHSSASTNTRTIAPGSGIGAAGGSSGGGGLHASPCSSRSASVGVMAYPRAIAARSTQ